MCPAGPIWDNVFISLQWIYLELQSHHELLLCIDVSYPECIQ
jgi:hypothetical protein